MKAADYPTTDDETDSDPELDVPESEAPDTAEARRVPGRLDDQRNADDELRRVVHRDLVVELQPVAAATGHALHFPAAWARRWQFFTAFIKVWPHLHVHGWLRLRASHQLRLLAVVWFGNTVIVLVDYNKLFLIPVAVFPQTL